jgi:hypothetical protein
LFPSALIRESLRVRSGMSIRCDFSTWNRLDWNVGPDFLKYRKVRLTSGAFFMDYVQGRATIFGLNWDGSPDPTDNGQGYFGYDTRDKSLVGVSLPIAVINGTIGNYKDPETIKRIKSKAFRVKVRAHTGKEIVAQIVDVGPAKWTHNAIDLTYGAARGLGLTDNSDVTYWVIDHDGNIVPIHGWGG